MPEDDTIGQIIRRDLDRLPMLPAERWLPPHSQRNERRWLRPASAIGLARTLSIGLTVVVVAVAAGIGLSNWRAQRAALEESQASAPGIPGPLNLAGGAPSLGFGLVSTSANTLLVRNEVTESALLTISFALPQVAVSPNGHEIVYWLALPDRFSAAPLYQLHRADLLIPGSTICCGGMLMRAPSGEVPGPLIWSSDGTGLIANTHTPPTRGSDAGAASLATHATWFKIDVATAKTEQLPQTFADAFSVVYAWDRSRDLVTGSTISFGSPLIAGGPTFLTFKGGVIQSHPVPIGGLIAAADAYGKSVVLEYAANCQPTLAPRPCPTLEVRDQATFAITTSVPLAIATRDYADVTFRPRSQDLIVQIPLPNGDAQLELWADLGRGPHQILATYSQTVRFTGRRELVFPRVDGSAVFLLKFDSSAGGRWFGDVVGLYPIKGATGFERTPFEILSGGNPLASVVLDPAFARAMDPRVSAAPPPAPSSSALPVCPGQSPILDVAQPPAPGDQPGTGAADPEAAFNRAFPTIKDYKMYEFGSTNPYVAGLTPPNGPIWIVADGRTFISLYVGGAPGQNSWFAHPATFLGCRDARDLQPKSPTAACPGVIEAVQPSAGTGQLYPTRTASEVVSGLAKDPYLHHTLEDIAGVRQDSNPLRDSGVPRCAVDALTIGDLRIVALAQPSASVIVVHNYRTNELWAIPGTTVTPVPVQAALTGQVMLESISHDGRTVSFSQPGNTPPARTGVIDLQTGAVTFMCTSGCWRLVVN